MNEVWSLQLVWKSKICLQTTPSPHLLLHLLVIMEWESEWETTGCIIYEGQTGQQHQCVELAGDRAGVKIGKRRSEIII